MKTNQLRLIFEILLGICFASSLLLAYAISVSNEALGEQVFALKKQAQETKLSLRQQLAEMRIEKDTLAQNKQEIHDPELEAIKSAFANGVILQDLETYYKTQKNWSTDRQVGVATLQLLAKGAKDESTIASIQKALDMAELGWQKKCGVQNVSLSNAKNVC